MADDIGYADVSCYGRPDLQTPNIDRLAARGVRFMQAYANSAVCTATRVGADHRPLSVPAARRARRAAGDGGANDRPASRAPDLPSLLQKAGYATALVGKWHSARCRTSARCKSGYDQFCGFRGGGVDYYTHNGTGQKPDLWDDDVPVERAGYMTELLGDRAVQVDQRATRRTSPFFISLHFTAPHWPWEAPGDEAESQRIRADRYLSLRRRHAEDLSRMIDELDAQIGRVARSARHQRRHRQHDRRLHQRQRRRAVLRYLAVHRKEDRAARGRPPHPGDRVVAGGLPQNRTSEQVAITMDWLPTLLAAAGAAPDPAYPTGRHEPAAHPSIERCTSPAAAFLALQGKRAACDARW